jgi:hypothetical protein
MFTLPFWALSVLKGIKDFFAKLTWKHYAGFAVILLFLFAQWKFYTWAEENGRENQFAIDTPIIEALTKDIKIARNDLKAYKDSFDKWKKDTDAANAKLEEQNKTLSETLAAKIAENQRLSRQKQKVLIREIPKFIPASVDYDLPVGFVQLYNFSIQTPTTGKESTISFSPSGDVTAPSGITLSRASSETFIPNNTQCLLNRDMVIQWQTWYRETKISFDEANKVKTDTLQQMSDRDKVIPVP